MIHLYYGDGKGKTTAAMGLALRMAGRGRKVVIAQFLKGADSGERMALANVPGIQLLPVPEAVPFSFALTETQRQQETARYGRLLEDCLRLAQAPDCGLLVLDEVCDAADTGLLPPEQVQKLLDHLSVLHAEVVLTGHTPAPEFFACAHYITCLRKERHPYDAGQQARCGVEF